jgi:hypothetical protein
MYKKIIAFFTAKIFLTRGQAITQGMLYQLEKEVVDLKKSVRGHKSSYTRLKDSTVMLEEMYDASVAECTRLRADYPLAEKEV